MNIVVIILYIGQKRSIKALKVSNKTVCRIGGRGLGMSLGLGLGMRARFGTTLPASGGSKCTLEKLSTLYEAQSDDRCHCGVPYVFCTVMKDTKDESAVMAFVTTKGEPWDILSSQMHKKIATVKGAMVRSTKKRGSKTGLWKSAHYRHHW